MFDSHCHLTDINEPLAVLQAAKVAGVTSLLCCGYRSCTNTDVLGLRAMCPGLPIALGVHPWFAAEGVDGLLSLLESSNPTCVGEIGLDGKQGSHLPPLAEQESVYVAQLDMAQRLGLPVTVHSRRSVERVVALALAFPRVRGVLHAYAGSLEQIQRLLELGWMVGVGGAATRRSAHQVRRLVKRLPFESMLLETDSPAIGLEGVYPPDVRPHHLVAIARAVAEVRGVDIAQVIAETDANAHRMFGEF